LYGRESEEPSSVGNVGRALFGGAVDEGWRKKSRFEELSWNLFPSISQFLPTLSPSEPLSQVLDTKSRVQEKQPVKLLL